MIPSPLASKASQSVSVCGKMLMRGKTILVPESAVGPRERKMEKNGKIAIRKSNTKGMLQILCTL